MATQSEVQNTLLAASLKVANLVNTNGTFLAAGGLTVEWGYINLMQRAINCVQRQYNLGDYISAPFIIAYNRLLNFVGIDAPGTINPNAQGGGIVINNTPTSGGIVFVSKTEGNLLYDSGADAYYLPFLDEDGIGFPLGSVPVSVVDNGVQQEPALTTAYTPQRIYGFANAVGPQAIVVTVLIPSV